LAESAVCIRVACDADLRGRLGLAERPFAFASLAMPTQEAGLALPSRPLAFRRLYRVFVPVLRIEALPQAERVDVEAALERLCNELAELVGEAPGGTWAAWGTLDHYVEGVRPASTQPASTHPTLVRLTAFEGKPPNQVADLLRRTASVLERELRLDPGNVFVSYEEARRGLLYTGGEVVT
jgi:hypothetical protein